MLSKQHDSQYAVFLNTKGRTIADAILSLATNVDANEPTLLISVESAQAGPLLQHLKKYMLRARFRLADWTNDYATHLFLPHAPFSATGGIEDSRSLVAALRNRYADTPNCTAFIDPRSHRIGVRTISPLKAEPLVQVSELQQPYHQARLLLGLPEGEEVTDCVCVEANIQYLHGVSFEKGCYLGQELVARANFRGQVRKRYMPVIYGHVPSHLTRGGILCANPSVLHGQDLSFITESDPGRVNAGEEILDGNGAKVGKVVTAGNYGLHAGFAVIRLEAIAHTLVKSHARNVDVSASGTHGIEDDCTDAFVRNEYEDLNSRCNDGAVALKTESGVKVTPILPMYWRHIRA